MTPGLAAGAARGIIARYRAQLPVSDATPVVSLGEGDSPLLRSERLSHELGADVWLKHEGLNPTGSFKDRGMTLAISKALEEGARAVVCASTGNTSASAAAYAARAGLRCGVLIPKGHVALGKLAQALIHGATVLEIDGSFDLALELTKELAARGDVQLVNSINPHRVEGQKTAAFEIVETLGRSPDVHVIPVGNAGNITSYWRGYRQAIEVGWCTGLPAMHGFQAEGANPIVRGEVVSEPETLATAIRIGNPASWQGALDAARESGGAIDSVTDDEMLAAYESLAREGIFVELASAASVAGLRKMSAAGSLPRGATVACTLTGNGLKDPDRAFARSARPKLVEPRISTILGELGIA